jgi:peptidyl-prolyl cis-trans isomerase C
MSLSNKRRIKKFYSPFICFLICLLAFGLTACQKKDEKSSAAKKETSTITPAPQPAAPADNAAQNPDGLVVEVDGTKLTKAQLDAELNHQMALIKNKYPADKTQQVKANIQRQIIDGFVVRTLLTNEVNRLKINATEQEVTDFIEKIKSTLPPNVTLEELIKKNKTTMAKMREGIRLQIRIEKLMAPKMKDIPKPKDKEISAFYKNNPKRFVVPEAMHVRHILIATAPEDTDKIIAEKKAKAENLHKQLLNGSDFAELAKNNSDCPSKNSGGDLGIIKRGDMVKPFEDAVFALKKNQIGPVVRTEFGFHVIQVLDVRQPNTVALDEKTKVVISTFLQQQKQQEVFKKVIQNLKEKAKIVVYQS